MFILLSGTLPLSRVVLIQAIMYLGWTVPYGVFQSSMCPILIGCVQYQCEQSAWSSDFGCVQYQCEQRLVVFSTSVSSVHEAVLLEGLVSEETSKASCNQKQADCIPALSHSAPLCRPSCLPWVTSIVTRDWLTVYQLCLTLPLCAGHHVYPG